MRQCQCGAMLLRPKALQPSVMRLSAGLVHEADRLQDRPIWQPLTLHLFDVSECRVAVARIWDIEMAAHRNMRLIFCEPVFVICLGRALMAELAVYCVVFYLDCQNRREVTRPRAETPSVRLLRTAVFECLRQFHYDIARFASEASCDTTEEK